MDKEKVFAWIEDLEDMADQSDRYFVERTELYKENQEKDKEIERLNNIINELKEEVCEYEQLIDIQDKREYHKRYLEERRKEQPNLLYPDYDEIYKRYYAQKDIINKAIEYAENNDEVRKELLSILRGKDNE